jgi:hypothetical protein
MPRMNGGNWQVPNGKATHPSLDEGWASRPAIIAVESFAYALLKSGFMRGLRDREVTRASRDATSLRGSSG